MSAIPAVTVAIVDDDENVRRAFSRLLRADGIHSVPYCSGEALLADPARGRFHCLVLDVQLAGMSGIELARTLAREGHHGTVIFVTGCDDPNTRTSAEATGCAAFFHKIDAGQELLSAIRTLTREEVPRLNRPSALDASALAGAHRA